MKSQVLHRLPSSAGPAAASPSSFRHPSTLLSASRLQAPVALPVFHFLYSRRWEGSREGPGIYLLNLEGASTTTYLAVYISLSLFSEVWQRLSPTCNLRVLHFCFHYPCIFFFMILEILDMYLCDYLINDILLDYKFHRGRDFISFTTHGAYVLNE